jgi:hypothetical protein
MPRTFTEEPGTGSTITVVLPVDDDVRDRVLAAGVGRDLLRHDRPLGIGVVDNGLWRSTPVLLAHVERLSGSALGERHPFDHLAEDFGEQQRALPEFAGRVDAALAVLGN